MRWSSRRPARAASRRSAGAGDASGAAAAQTPGEPSRAPLARGSRAAVWLSPPVRPSLHSRSNLGSAGLCPILQSRSALTGAGLCLPPLKSVRVGGAGLSATVPHVQAHAAPLHLVLCRVAKQASIFAYMAPPLQAPSRLAL